MKYLRFVRPNAIEHLGAREGFFCAAYDLRGKPGLDQYTSDRLEDHLGWFREHLASPGKCSRSTSKGSLDRNAAGLSWFKHDATEVIARAYDLIHLLRDNGYPIEIIRTERVGSIVYEDAHQAVAEPFSDTPV